MIRLILAVALAASLAAAGTALAQQRSVVVNGALMNPQQLQVLDILAGEPVPDGRYWLDPVSGAWGYEGGPVEGVLGAPEAPPSGGGQKRYFEDDVADFCARNGGCPW